MTGQRPYDVVGTEPMSDADLDAAIRAWEDDNPDDAMQRFGGASRLRRLNAEAHERAEAEALGVTLAALREGDAEAKRAARADQHARDVDVVVASRQGGRVKRPGRPAWTRSLFDRRYREAWEATPAPRTDDDVAKRFVGLSRDGAVGIDPDSLARLRRRAARGDMPE